MLSVRVSENLTTCILRQSGRRQTLFFNLGLTISLAVTTGTLVYISYIWFITRDEDSTHSVWQHPKLSAFFFLHPLFPFHICATLLNTGKTEWGPLNNIVWIQPYNHYWIGFYVEASCQSGEMRLQSKRGSWKLLQARAGISTIVRLQSPTNALADMWLLLKTVTLIPFQNILYN